MFETRTVETSMFARRLLSESITHSDITDILTDDYDIGTKSSAVVTDIEIAPLKLLLKLVQMRGVIYTQSHGITISEYVPSYDLEDKQESYVNTNSIPESFTKNWRLFANSGLSENSYTYLLKLAKKQEGWRGQGSKALNTESLASFLRFWLDIKKIASEPEFVLLPNGNLQTEWYKDDKHFTELEFQPDNRVLFGIFDGKDEIEGEAQQREVTTILAGDRNKIKRLNW